MARIIIIGIVIAVAFTLFALVDAAMSDGARARGVAKPVWVVLIVVLPVIGGVLWFMIGKGHGQLPMPATSPDDDPRFGGRTGASGLSNREVDERMRELEERLRELDDEVYPGEPDSPDGESGDGGSRGNDSPRADRP